MTEKKPGASWRDTVLDLANRSVNRGQVIRDFQSLPIDVRALLLRRIGATVSRDKVPDLGELTRAQREKLPGEALSLGIQARQARAIVSRARWA